MRLFLGFLIVFFPILGFSNEIQEDSLNGTMVAFSPDHRWMAIVEPSKHLKIPEECDPGPGTVGQIWLFDLKNAHKSLLVNPQFNCDNPETAIISIESLQFSIDSKTLYFQTPGWPVSGALHAIDLDGKNLRYIAPSNSFALISGGVYAGDLAIAQHRYFIPVGSYDAYWAYNPQGKEIGFIGSDLTHFQDEENEFS